MNPIHEAGGLRMNRRAALTILAGAGAALKVAAPSVAHAQAVRTFNPAQVLNGADVRLFPAEIKSELKQLAPNVYAYVQLQPPGWSNFNISNCGLVVGTDSVLAVDAAAAPLMANTFLAAAERATGKSVKRVVVTHFHGDHTGGDRWGVIFRDLLARETLAPPWRSLLVVLRQMEARGEIRGGRFISGFVGEQYARPEAVDLLRSLRRAGPAGEEIEIPLADPLNLTGSVLPGPRTSALAQGSLRLRDGVPQEDGLKDVLREIPENQPWPAAL